MILALHGSLDDKDMQLLTVQRNLDCSESQLERLTQFWELQDTIFVF